MPYFDFEIPTALPGVDPKILDPRDTYAEAAQWDAKAKDLAERFIKNFKKFEGNEAGKKLVRRRPETLRRESFITEKIPAQKRRDFFCPHPISAPKSLPLVVRQTCVRLRNRRNMKRTQPMNLFETETWRAFSRTLSP